MAIPQGAVKLWGVYSSLSPDMFLFLAIKKPVGKTKEELALEKKRELEKRLQDVSGQLNSTKKPPKKGEYLILQATASSLYSALSIAFFLTNGHQLYMFSTFNVQLCSVFLASEKTESSSAQQVAVSRLSASSSSSDSSSSSSSSSSSDTSDSDSG